jgi:hypothetical protein
MYSKTKNLDSLFQKWEDSNLDCRGHFVKDGIIDEELFEVAKHKILFITKEPNNLNQDAGDFRTWWKEELKYAFSLRVSEWAYGIQKDFPPYDIIKKSASDKLDAINKIAFLNIKKTGGGGTAEFERISNHLKQNLNLIHEEIEIIDPDIIILGISWKELRSELFPDIKDKWKESGYDIAIARYKEARVIDFYHPSSRTAPSASYSLLQNVIRSPEFEKL